MLVVSQGQTITNNNNSSSLKTADLMQQNDNCKSLPVLDSKCRLVGGWLLQKIYFKSTAYTTKKIMVGENYITLAF